MFFGVIKGFPLKRDFVETSNLNFHNMKHFITRASFIYPNAGHFGQSRPNFSPRFDDFDFQPKKSVDFGISDQHVFREPLKNSNILGKNGHIFIGIAPIKSYVFSA